jgi:hypothetical protein
VEIIPVRTGISILSYADNVTFGITGDGVSELLLAAERHATATRGDCPGLAREHSAKAGR